MESFAVQRSRMVDSQLRTESVTDHAVLDAMGIVQREVFVPADQKALAYVDRDVPLKDASPAAGPRALMEPAPLARLIQALDLGGDERALVIGAGTGYAAAVLARLARSVVAVESDPALAAQMTHNLRDLAIANVTVIVGPLEAGHPPGPYDAILFDGSVEVIPDAIQTQLAEGGRLAAVMGYGRAAQAVMTTRADGKAGGLPIFDADVPPLPGFRKPQVFVF